MQSARRDCPGQPVETASAWSADAGRQALAPWPSSGQTTLGRELLAAVATALVDDGATVLGSHARTETMAAGTHELRRLISTLHEIKPRWAQFLLIAALEQEYRTHMERGAPTVRVGGVYRENSTPSQRATR